MRVLVVSSSSFSDTGNNGKTLCSLFSNLKSRDIAQLYFGTNEEPYVEFCDNYYRITETDILKSLFNFSYSVRNSHNALVSSINSGTHKEAWWFRILKMYEKKIRLIREALWKLNTWDTQELDAWIKEFNPDIVFALLGSSMHVHNIAIRLSERYNLPLFTYFTDDYVINSTAKGVVEKIHYRLLCKQYKKTIRRSSRAYVIGEKMQKDYSEMYSKPFGVLGNCIDMDKYSHIHPRKIEQNEPIIISYMGALHSNRWVSISKLGNIVKEINGEYGYQMYIKVFSTATPSKEIIASFEKSGVEFCGGLDSSGVIAQMERSHFLLHVESFDEVNRTYVKYSISTKISEYLSSSRGIMAYGPHEVASMELLCKNGFGCGLTDLDSHDEIKKKIYEAIEGYNNHDYSLSKQYVIQNYNKEMVSQRLIKEMSDSIQQRERM
ncbi:MAG: glycosyltransferase [Rikenellaceae bacterium]|nr:glycosyltransferase [Rikenellaceae bacterium]